MPFHSSVPDSEELADSILMAIIRSALQLYLSQTSPILVGLAQSPATA